MNKKYTIDGTNICHWMNLESGKVSLLPLLTIIQAILENGDDFYCVFDANTRYNIEPESDVGLFDSLLKQDKTRFYCVTGQSQADTPIVTAANEDGSAIISNDFFRPYHGNYPWLAERNNPRLIQGNLQPNGLLTLDKLSYGTLKLRTSSQVAVNAIIGLLAAKDSPEFNALEQTLAAKRAQIEQAEERLQQLNTLIAQQEVLAADIEASNKQLSTSRAAVQLLAAELVDMHATDRPSESALTEQRIANDQERIRRVNAEIQAFLEPYQVGRANGRIKIPFSGSTWNAAVKALEVYLDRNHVCEHCYETNSQWKDRCLDCHKGMMINRPPKILQIIERHAPARSIGACKTAQDEPSASEAPNLPNAKIAPSATKQAAMAEYTPEQSENREEEGVELSTSAPEAPAPRKRQIERFPSSVVIRSEESRSGGFLSDALRCFRK